VVVWNVGNNATNDTSHRHIQIRWEDAKEGDHLGGLGIDGKINSSKRWTTALQYRSLDLTGLRCGLEIL
jgi:hypothetical protein